MMMMMNVTTTKMLPTKMFSDDIVDLESARMNQNRMDPSLNCLNGAVQPFRVLAWRPTAAVAADLFGSLCAVFVLWRGDVSVFVSRILDSVYWSLFKCFLMVAVALDCSSWPSSKNIRAEFGLHFEGRQRKSLKGGYGMRFLDVYMDEDEWNELKLAKWWAWSRVLRVYAGSEITVPFQETQDTGVKDDVRRRCVKWDVNGSRMVSYLIGTPAAAVGRNPRYSKGSCGAPPPLLRQPKYPKHKVDEDLDEELDMIMEEVLFFNQHLAPFEARTFFRGAR